MRRLFNGGLTPTTAEPSASPQLDDNLNLPQTATIQQGDNKKGWFSTSNLVRTLSSTSVIPPPHTSPIRQQQISNGFLPHDNAQQQQRTSIILPFAQDRLAALSLKTIVNSDTSQHNQQEKASKPDEFMLQLLSSQAAVEAREYSILPWDEMAQIKKEHTVLATRIAGLTRSVALETRLRDSAAKLVRLSVPPPSLTAANGQPSPAAHKTRVTKEQATAQLLLADEKLAQLSADLYKLGWKESQLERQLLKHTAGVLALALGQSEENDTTSNLGASTSSLVNRVASPASSTGTSSRFDERFEGHHFFAGNKEAITPVARTAPLSDSLTPVSPMDGAPTLPIDTSHYDNQIASLRSTNDQLSSQISHLNTDAGIARRASEDARITANDLRSELAQAREMAEELRKDVDDARMGNSSHEEAHAGTRREMESLLREVEESRTALDLSKREVEDGRREIVMARSGSSDHARDIADAMEQTTLANDRARKSSLEADDLRRSHERDLLRLQRDNDARGETERSRGRTDLAALESERRTLTQSIGDVLRHYRARPALGAVWRDVPAFDDSPDRADLSSYISKTIASHLERVGEHLASLDRGLISARAEGSQTSEALREELLTAVAAKEKARLEVLQLGRTNTALETSHDALLVAHAELTTAHENLLIKSPSPTVLNEKNMLIANLERKADIAQEEIAQLGSEFAEMQNKHSHLDEELLLTKKQHSKALTMLGSFEKEMETKKGDADRAKGVLDDRNRDLVGYQNQIKALEERAEVSATQEVAMLERLNEFTSILESTRAEKRKLDSLSVQHQATIKSLTSDSTALTASLAAAQAAHAESVASLAAISSRPDASAGKVSKLEEELQSVKDQLGDVEEELSDAKKRENTSRSRLLDELNEKEAEVSQLKTALRQEQRKKGTS